MPVSVNEEICTYFATIGSTMHVRRLGSMVCQANEPDRSVCKSVLHGARIAHGSIKHAMPVSVTQAVANLICRHGQHGHCAQPLAIVCQVDEPDRSTCEFVMYGKKKGTWQSACTMQVL